MIVVFVVFIILVLSGILLFGFKKDMKTKLNATMDKSTQVIDKNSDETEEARVINDMDPITYGNSFSEIENDIDSTVIMEEDFSDL
jgi:hypothetical protein